MEIGRWGSERGWTPDSVSSKMLPSAPSSPYKRIKINSCTQETNLRLPHTA